MAPRTFQFDPRGKFVKNYTSSVHLAHLAPEILHVIFF